MARLTGWLRLEWERRGPETVDFLLGVVVPTLVLAGVVCALYVIAMESR